MAMTIWERMQYIISRRAWLLGLGSSLFIGAASDWSLTAAPREVPAGVPPEWLPEWSAASQAILRKSLVGPAAPGRITAEDVAALARAEGVAVDALVARLLSAARWYSRPPISNFRVGAVAVGASGAVYPGANIEVSGNALNQAVHAEQSAVASAFSHREAGITTIATSAAPCGHCRQFLNEITEGSRIRVVVPGEPVRLLSELLPASFGPKDLGAVTGLLDSPPSPMRLLTGGSDALARMALEAATRAYAPYSKSPSGCAVAMESGRVYAGSYVENAAFNPSLSPLQAALVNAVLAGEEVSAIRRVALVERRGAAISQRATTAAVLNGLAPRAQMDVFVATATA